MISASVFKCQNYQELSEKLHGFDTDLEKGNVRKERLCKISEFIENNKDLFIGNRQVAIVLDSIATKLCRVDRTDPLVNTLQKHIEQLLPTNREQVKASLQFFRNTITDPIQRLQSIADWISVMKVPLAHLDLSEEELAWLLVQLEHIDLSDYHFESHNLKKFTEILLKPHLKFRTKNTIVLGTIARLCAKQDGHETSLHFKNFEIDDPALRFDIACLCAENSGVDTAECIKNFEIVEQADRTAIACLCVKKGGVYSILPFIKNFEIYDPTLRADFARCCAEQDGYSTAASIKNFGIANSETRIEIAYICAQNCGAGTAKFIKNFEISDPVIRIEIARLCAQNNGGATAEYVKNFEIADPALRIEIARLCVQNGCYTAKFIKNFEIRDPVLRIKMARLCAGKSGVDMAKHIKNFEIVEQADRAEIACLCLKKSCFSSILPFIKNFEIHDPKLRAHIARFCAKENALGTAENFKYFEIEDKALRTSIARLCAERGRGTAEWVKNFDILTDHNSLEMFYLYAISDPQSLFSMKNFLPLPTEVIKFSELIQILKSEQAEKSLRDELFDEIDQLILKLSLSKHCQQALLTTSREFRALSPHVQNVVGLWFLVSILTMRSLKSDAVEWMIEQGVWRELALLRDPSLRILLSRGLYELSGDENKRKLWEGFLSSVRGGEGQKGLMLLAIPFFALEKEGIEEKRLLEVAKTLAKYQKEKIAQLRSVYHIKNILHTLMALLPDDTFSAEMKKRAFEKIFSASNEKNLIKNTIAAKGLLQLKDQDWPKSSKDLNVLFHNSLEKMIPLENCKVNVSEKYEEIFGSCRNPGGLLTYAAGLKTLGEPEVMACLGRYVVSVLDGSFKEKRYHTKNHPHLAKIIPSNPSLLNTWIEDLSFDLEPLSSSENNSMAFNPTSWLERKLITDGHLGDTKFIFLSRYLDINSDKKAIFQELLEQLQFVRKEKQKNELRKEIGKLKRSLKELKGDDLKASEKKQAQMNQALSNLNKQVSEDPALAQLNLEKACLNFIQKGEGAEDKVLLEHSIDIGKALKQKTSHTTFASSEFAKDVEGLIKDFEEKIKSKGGVKEGLKVVFTDHSIDILLCGTDVSGSCQRVEGDPNLNKGLLGYLVDGKNRLLAIKEGDKIIARCMLSLLWDGEKPVIYRERFYPDTTPENYKNALNILAKKVAKKLNAPLTSNDAGTLYGKNLEALGGSAPYEYSDGSGGVKKDGCYTIIEAKLIV